MSDNEINTPNNKPFIMPGWVDDELVPKDVMEKYLYDVDKATKQSLIKLGFRETTPAEKVIFVLHTVGCQIYPIASHVFDYMLATVREHSYGPTQFLEQVDIYIEKHSDPDGVIGTIADWFIKYWKHAPDFVPDVGGMLKNYISELKDDNIL